MLDDPPKLRLGAALDAAAAQWREALQVTLTARGARPLGASADVLAPVPEGGIAQSALAERVGLSKQAVQQFLDQLEAHGLVRRESDPADRRAKRVFITEAGRQALAARREAERELERAWRDALGRKSFARLRKTLKTLSAGRASIRG